MRNFFRELNFLSAIVIAGVLVGSVLLDSTWPALAQWLTLGVLLAFISLAQLLKKSEPRHGHVSFDITTIFLFGGALLLSPSLYVILVLLQQAIHWTRQALVIHQPQLVQDAPLELSAYLLAGSATAWIWHNVNPDLWSSTIVALTVTASTFLILHHVLGALAIAARTSLREFRWIERGGLLNDLLILLLGGLFAVLWRLNPWLGVLAFAQLALVNQVLQIPQLEKQAQTDEKTGLWNARHFNSLFAAELERARRFERPLAVVMADLDLLRNLNNTYGHLAGDQVLAGVGQIIDETLRQFDSAARFGGEEFAILLHEAGAYEARSIAERLRLAVAAAEFHIPTQRTPLHVTVSLGVACYPSDAATEVELLHAADIALYHAKRAGRNRTAFASDFSETLLREGPPFQIPSTVTTRQASLGSPGFLRLRARAQAARGWKFFRHNWTKNRAAALTALTIVLMLAAFLFGRASVAPADLSQARPIPGFNPSRAPTSIAALNAQPSLTAVAQPFGSSNPIVSNLATPTLVPDHAQTTMSETHGTFAAPPKKVVIPTRTKTALPGQNVALNLSNAPASTPSLQADHPAASNKPQALARASSISQPAVAATHAAAPVVAPTLALNQLLKGGTAAAALGPGCAQLLQVLSCAQCTINSKNAISCNNPPPVAKPPPKPRMRPLPQPPIRRDEDSLHARSNDNLERRTEKPQTPRKDPARTGK